jgi:uncharacterized membrane protein YjgN (DUF898 family)
MSKGGVRKNQTHKNNKMAGITTYLSIITLNANGLNSPIKRHRLVDWMKKQEPDGCDVANLDSQLLRR